MRPQNTLNDALETSFKIFTKSKNKNTNTYNHHTKNK